MATADKRSALPFTRNILVPTAGRVVLLAGYSAAGQSGEIVVRYESTGTPDRVFGQITNEGVATTLPDNLPAMLPPAGCFELTRVGLTTNYENLNAPVTNVPQSPAPSDPHTNTKRVYVREYDNTGAATGAAVSNGFIAMPPTVTVSVPGTACLWLTYDTSGAQMPHQETSTNPVYVPPSVVVPSDGEANHVTVSAAGSWGHGPGLTSGPEGLAQTEDVRPGYRDAAFNSAHITGGTFRLNRLVALRQYDSDQTDTPEIDVGTNWNEPIVANGMPRPIALRFGLHDGYEWSNNEGEVTVTLTWSTQ